MNNGSKKSNGGILIGLIFIVGGIFLLWFNEGRTVKTAQTIGEAKKQYIDVSSASIDSKNDGKLVATNGQLEVPSTGVSDASFGVWILSPKLKRTVEMYQWQENCTEDDNGNQNCHYNQVWDDEVINSSNFENHSYVNPSSMPYSSETFYASNTKVGAYTLNEELLNQLNTTTKMNVTSNTKAEQMGLIANENYYTNVQNNTPKIGDVRISFSYSNEKNVSVLAVQNNNTFSRFTTDNGYSIYELKEGNFNGQEMLNQLTNKNNSTKWLLRIIGMALVIVGFAALIAPLQRLANFIPIFGTIFGWITGIITFVIGLLISIIVIALAWFRYRPILSASALIAAAIIFALLKKKKTSTSNNSVETNI